MRTTDENDVIRVHGNVGKYALEYPQEFKFAEEYELTVDDTRIPTDRYTSPEVLREEIETTWMRTWQLACREEQVAEIGAYYEYRIAGRSYLVVRGEDCRLRAFVNSCRHRGKLIRTGSGTTDELRCGYHYWCWGLDGSLADIPDRHVFVGIDDDEYALGQIACDTWAGFVFVNPDTSCPPLSEYLGDVTTQLAPYNMDKFRANLHASLEIDCNWKVAIEAFIETYHVQGIHPQIMPYVDDFNTKFDIMGDHTRYIVPFGVPSMRIEHIDEAEVYESHQRALRKPGLRDRSTPPPPETRVELPADLFNEQGEWIGEGTLRDHLIDLTRERGESLGHDYSGLGHAQLVDDYHYHIFPSMYFNLHAGALLLFRSRPHATDPNKSHFDVWRLFMPDLTKPMPEPAQEFRADFEQTSFGTVLDQDFENLPEVQAGLKNPEVEFVTLGGAEIRIINFHKVLRQYAQRFGAK
ncbi:aromatic ring-hydroxylating oxygenase subunit alpha [Dietzia lutea]|uniref:Rieske domain-containing protein n=1 Tax=Dietzia lutea TaxID=546160 RepID=A0A2S1R9Z0_9ACTN|nr:aromatic ring-hydroxylating dioxygenase subunit alpha [Dietzia lutea]AWH93110.1 hypothetical protein A6035_14045 [Dietzia lutea]